MIYRSQRAVEAAFFYRPKVGTLEGASPCNLSLEEGPLSIDTFFETREWAFLLCVKRE